MTTSRCSAANKVVIAREGGRSSTPLPIVSIIDVSGILDRPVKPGDDDLFLTAPRFRSFSYAAAFMDK
jgi:hypothetical protein